MIIENGIGIGITQKTAEVQVEKFEEIIEQSYEIIDIEQETPIQIETEIVDKPQTNIEFYSQFTERELAYIYSSKEITDEMVFNVLRYKFSKTAEAIFISDSKYIPIDILARFGQYESKRTQMTSREILDVPITYKGWNINDFAELWKSDEYNFGHDKCIYMMRKLDIFNKSEWSSLTGYVSKGARFLPEVGKNIAGAVEFVAEGIGKVASETLKIATDIATDVAESFLENILGKNWKLKLGIGIVVIIVIIVLGLIGYSYTKTYVGAKATKKATT